MEKILYISKEYRIAFTRVFGAAFLFLLLFSGYSWSPNIYMHLAVDLVAFVLILVCTFGRLWALAYISGHKTKDLITDGPYSLVRNPLYLFSLIGAFGVGLVSKNVVVFALILILFVIYYPFVIRAEEKHLLEVHGHTFEEYKAKTPMFIPNFKGFKEQQYYSIDARLFRRAFFSVTWFPLIYMILLAIDRLHVSGLVPVLFTVP
ncbi:MAG: isoprenylcysteine carboxylmethyltransferase family protein [Deltaproteobacteria bacterium]|nr:isoprenylcysteine carboxylmethyltransferase family protein [Deltaproteobacteria bacterium]